MYFMFVSGCPDTAIAMDKNLDSIIIYNHFKRFTQHPVLSFYFYIKVMQSGDILTFKNNVSAHDDGGFSIRISGVSSSNVLTCENEGQAIFSEWNKITFYKWHHIGITVDSTNHIFL